MWITIAFLERMDQVHTMASFLAVVGGRGAKVIREEDVVFDSRCKVTSLRCRPKDIFVEEIDTKITNGVLEREYFVTDGVRQCADMLGDGTLRYAEYSTYQGKPASRPAS